MILIDIIYGILLRESVAEERICKNGSICTLQEDVFNRTNQMRTVNSRKKARLEELLNTDGIGPDQLLNQKIILGMWLDLPKYASYFLQVNNIRIFTYEFDMF